MSRAAWSRCSIAMTATQRDGRGGDCLTDDGGPEARGHYDRRMETSDPAIDALLAQRSHIVETTMDALVPGYPRRRRVHDLESGIGAAFDAIIRCALEGRRLTEQDIAFLRSVVRNASLRGGTEAEILQAPLMFLRVLWSAMTKTVGGTPDGDRSIVRLTPTILDYVDIASDVTHEVHLMVREAQNSLSSVARFELTERLIAGSPLEPGTQLNLARRCGLTEQGPVLVIIARMADDGRPEMALPMSMRVLTRAATSRVAEPLSVVRDDEIVVIRATPHRELESLAHALDDARHDLSGDDMPLVVATSTIHDGLASVPAAYDEACLALESLRGVPGFLSLANVDALDYLMLRAGHTAAWRLIPEPIREFVSDELAGDRALVDTLLAFVDCDLNVKRAAEQLYVHPNTAHYRLDRIAEQTQCSLRRFEDLEQLIMAVRLGTSMHRE